MRALWLVAVVCGCGVGGVETGSGEVAQSVREQAAAPARAPACSATTLSREPEAARRLTEVNALAVAVSIARGCSADAVSIELVTPTGRVFEARTQLLDGSQQVTFRFPVAGSVIEHRGLFGTWQVRTFVDGTLAAAQPFELNR